ATAGAPPRVQAATPPRRAARRSAPSPALDPQTRPSQLSAIREMPSLPVIGGNGVATERPREGLAFEWRAERHTEAILHGAAGARVSPELGSRPLELSAAARA